MGDEHDGDCGIDEEFMAAWGCVGDGAEGCERQENEEAEGGGDSTEKCAPGAWFLCADRGSMGAVGFGKFIVGEGVIEGDVHGV